MNKEQHDVLEFQTEVCGLNLNQGLALRGPSLEFGTPGLVERVLEGKQDFLAEELGELTRAITDRNLVEIIDALIDIRYVCCDLANWLGVDLEPFHDEVHRSNMTKVGGYLNEETMKFIKPKTYQPPQLQPILDKIERHLSKRRKVASLLTGGMVMGFSPSQAPQTPQLESSFSNDLGFSSIPFNLGIEKED